MKVEVKSIGIMYGGADLEGNSTVLGWWTDQWCIWHLILL